MEKVDNLGEIFFEGNTVNMNKSSIKELDEINEKIVNEEKKIKNELFEMAKKF